MPTACVISSEMFFAMRIVAAAKTMGVDCLILRSAVDVSTKLPADCRLAMIDLGANPACDLLQLASGIRERAPSAKIVAFGPHVDHELLARASEAGCTTMSNGEFNGRYVNLLQKALSSS